MRNPFRRVTLKDGAGAYPQKYSRGSGNSYDSRPDTFNFMPDLIINEVWNVKSNKDIEKTTEMDAIAFRITYTIAREAFRDGFTFVDKDDTPIKSMDDIHKKLSDLKIVQVLTESCIAERKYGWSIIHLPSEKGEITRLRPYSPYNVDIGDLNGKGEIEFYKLNLKGMPQPEQLQSKDVVHVCINHKDSDYWRGISALAPVWDYLVLLRQIIYSGSEYSATLGQGFLVASLPGATKDQITEIKKNFKGLAHHKGMFLAQEGNVDMHGGSKDSGQFPAMAEMLLDQIAAGTGIPKEKLRGAQAGTISGSEENRIQEHQLYHSIHRNYEDIIREIIEKISDKELPDYYFQWETSIKYSEKEKAELEKTKADTLKTKAEWLSLLEIRKEQGLARFKEGERPLFQAEELFKLKVEEPVPIPVSNQELPVSEMGDQLDQIESITAFCKQNNISKKTFYKVKKALDNGNS